MARSRPKGFFSIGWASFEAAMMGRTEHVPTSDDYPDSVVRRVSFIAGGGLGWRLSALETPRETPPTWKIVVITGAPSWAEYWAPVLAALPQDRQMVVVDRPGFAASEPPTCIADIRVQAQALAPLLKVAPGQKILLVGQSYGAAIAVLMAAADPKPVGGVVMLSSYLGDLGPTARWLVSLGERMGALIPRDLRHAIIEVESQRAQLPYMRQALRRLRAPVHVIHGDKDDFAPMELAQKLVAETSHPTIHFKTAPGASHFLNDGPVEFLLECLESCIPPQAPAKPGLAWPKLAWPWTRRVASGAKAVGV
jgi:pimeloyl-ACP methyl ester carboxylesterase